MTREVTVTIDGLQQGDEESTVSVKATGIYHNRNGKHYIHYEESIEGGEGITKNTIKIASNQIDIIKKGVNTSNMVFALEESTQTRYETPYGSLLLYIKTTRIQVEENSDEILIRLHYTLSANDGHLSDNQVLIRVCSKN